MISLYNPKYRMKNLIVCILLFLITSTAFSQSPTSFKYQAIARNSSGAIIANQNISFKISILKGSIGGTSVYTETHNATSNQFGLVNLEIGKGSVVSGTIAAIAWHTDSYFIQVEMDATGGTNYIVMGTSQLLSVPYALHATTADTTLKGQQLKIIGDTLFISNGNWVILPKASNSFLIIDE